MFSVTTATQPPRISPDAHQLYRLLIDSLRASSMLLPDARYFAGLVAERHVFEPPGAFCEIPGHFRISLTASDDMIERSPPHFEAAFQQCRATEAQIA